MSKKRPRAQINQPVPSDIRGLGRGAPRFDRYTKLWGRFYEPLILLHVLGRTRGTHSTVLQPSPLHQLLDNLAYICDCEKGGATTSAVGLEDLPAHFTFWVASNNPNKTEGAAEFLKSVLLKVKQLKTVTPLTNRQRLLEEAELIRKCLKFALSRIKAEARLLGAEIAECKSCLSKSAIDQNLSTWFDGFNGLTYVELCLVAYSGRRSNMMRELASRSQSDAYAASFGKVRHRLGRLAAHIRAPRQIVQDCLTHPQLGNLLDVFEVLPVEAVPVSPRPEADSQTHIDGILNRMISGKLDIADLQRYKAALTQMDSNHQILARMLKQYEDKNFKPRIHGEIQILDHFSRNGRRFFANDRYIGCSKPACYCCHLYIRHHPLRCVEPRTSRKLYLNWGLRALPDGANDTDFTQQRDILIKMISTIRGDALEQILQQAYPLATHPDSVTGITMTASITPITDPNQSLGESLASLSINEADDSPDTSSDDSAGFPSSQTGSVSALSDQESEGDGRPHGSISAGADWDSDDADGGTAL